VILEQLILGLAVVAVVVVLLPFLLVMAGIGLTMLLGCVASAAVLLLAPVTGRLLVDRRYRSQTHDQPHMSNP
jgi:hypothetical protein